MHLYVCARACACVCLCVCTHAQGCVCPCMRAQSALHASQLASQPVQVVTFGCPYPGNRAWCREYEALVQDTWHVVHDRDPVPRAGKFFVLFKRPGCAQCHCQRPAAWIILFFMRIFAVGVGTWDLANAIS